MNCPKCGNEIVNQIEKSDDGGTLLKSMCNFCGWKSVEKSLNRFGDEETILK